MQNPRVSPSASPIRSPPEQFEQAAVRFAVCVGEERLQLLKGEDSLGPRVLDATRICPQYLSPRFARSRPRPFTRETAQQKVKAAKDAWNTCDPERVVLAYTIDSKWRNMEPVTRLPEAAHAAYPSPLDEESREWLRVLRGQGSRRDDAVARLHALLLRAAWVGGGDSFAAGMIYGVLTGADVDQALSYGVAHGALAMTTPGDTSTVTLAEVERAARGGAARVER